MEKHGDAFDGAGKFSGWHWQASNQNGSSGDTAAVTDSWRYSRNRCESRELEVEHDDKQPWMGFTMENLQAGGLGNLKWEKAARNGRGRGLKKANSGRTGGTGPSNSRLRRCSASCLAQWCSEVAFSSGKRDEGP